MIEHNPVMLSNVFEFVREISVARAGNLKIVDCTLGLGGYTEKFLQELPAARILGLDRDAAALAFAESRLASYGERFRGLHSNFGDMKDVLAVDGPFDVFVFDLGVSNMQLTEAERGFSFQHDGPLDMRMDTQANVMSAEEVLRTLDTEELADLFWRYGEERYSRLIAGKVGEYRKMGKLPHTTGELVALIRDALPAPVQRKMGAHPARRVFQALRIYVNNELGELENGLRSARDLAANGGGVAVVSYHSLEDRIVKHTFRAWEKEDQVGKVATKHPVLPSGDEVAANFKARSAKLREFRFS